MERISLDKKYKTRSGLEVILYHIFLDNPVHIRVHGAIKNRSNDIWNTATWANDGRYGSIRAEGAQDPFDLIEIRPYDHIKVDDKVLVWDNIHVGKFKRYFAGVADNGKPLTFSQRGTSWSSDGCSLVEWNFCEKVEDNGN